MPDTSRVNGSDDTEPTIGGVPEKNTEELLKVRSATQQGDTQAGPSFLRRLWPPVLLVVLIVAGGVLWWQQERVIDWVRLRGYSAPATIQDFASQTTMTPYAQRLFYVNHPAVQDKTAFNQNCPNATKEVAVLGCYRGNRQGIYIYHVTDARLAGIEQVTAAHEMLHQAYDRLGMAEKQHIDQLLTDYSATLTDKTVKDKIDSYRKLEPGLVADEMHSVFGTEIANLPAELETYYARYFTSRKQVLRYHTQYQSAFTQRIEQIAAYDQQRADLKGKIDAARADLDAREKDLKTRRSQMDSWLSAGKISQYNAVVPGFNADVEVYRQKVAETNALITQYNDLTDKRNTLAVEEQELLKAQDSQAPAAQ